MFDFVRKPLLWEAWDEGLDREIEDVGSGFSLKSMQDLAVYTHLREMVGAHIAEIGAGHSRLLPTLATTNTCVAVEQFEGEGGGPMDEKAIPGVRTISAYLGEQSLLLETASFDVVFSVSVVEHVRDRDLDGFHEDQLRILKPGGMFIHAIDLYVGDEPNTRFDAYRDWVTSDDVTPVGEVYPGPCRFTCDLATNPDNVMHEWGKVDPTLIELRQVAQGVSLLVAGRKVERTPQPNGEHDVVGNMAR